MGLRERYSSGWISEVTLLFRKYFKASKDYTNSVNIGISGLTTGLIPFANSSGVLDEDANLFWDNTLKSLGVGTVTPSTAKIVIVDTDLAGSGSLAGGVIDLEQTWNTSGNPVAIKLDVTNTASGANAKVIDLLVDSSSIFDIDPSGNITIVGEIILNAANNVKIITGSGDPENNVVAGIGSTFHRIDGGVLTSFYVKESGVGDTGWVAK